MAKNIEPKLKKIGDYLKLEEDTVFIIPEYQRAYSWKIEHCDKLWQDINDFVESESKDRYFFGTIIINCQENDTKYGLIDGQQRTTTFLLLLKALLVRTNIAIERTLNDDDSAGLRRGLQERRRRIMGILYKAETEDISDKPDSEKDAEICHRAIILKNFSINEQYKTELGDIISELETFGIADINSILMQYMYYIRTINHETISDTGAVNVTTPGLRRYFTEINKGPISDPLKMCTDMIKLSKIWKKVSDYPQIKVLLKFNENSKLFLASYFFRFNEEDITAEIVEPIVDCLLRLFSLLELGDAGYSSKYFKTFLFKEEAKFSDETIPVEEIKTDFYQHIISNWDYDTIDAALHDYDGNALVYLNEYLFAKETAVSFTLEAKCDIEHIMPHSGNNLQEIRTDAEIESEAEFIGVVNKLGNKILLEEKINRSIGNEWFRTKVSTKLENKTGYIDSKYPIARALVVQYQNKNKPYWKKGDIATATDTASERIAKFIFGN